MLLNRIAWISVYLYGLMLTAAFLHIPFTKKGMAFAVVQTLLCMAVQFGLEARFGYHAIEMAYPVICHLTILLASVFVFRCSLSSSAVALLAAYLLTLPRNLLGEAAALLWPGPDTKALVKILVTLPLLLLFLKLCTPPMRAILLRSRREQWLFLAPALAYYVMIYLTTVYTRLAYLGSVALVSLLGMLMCLFTFIYVFFDYRQLEKLGELRQRQQLIRLQASETHLRMEEIRYSQFKTKTMRHDLRHYLQIIYDYASEGNTSAIESYIHTIQAEIEDTVVQEYCQNESVNLIFSSYAGRAKRQGAALSVCAAMPQTLEGELDVCMVLANGLENALHACAELEHPSISAECRRYAGKTVIRIQNPCADTVKFADGIPISKEAGHGLGTRSIVALAKSHGGVADFSQNEGIFTLRAVL